MKDKIESAIATLVEKSEKMEYTTDMKQAVQYLRDEIHKRNMEYLWTFKDQGVSYVKITLGHVQMKDMSKMDYNEIASILHAAETKFSSSILQVEGTTRTSSGRPGANHYNVGLRFSRPQQHKEKI